MYIDVNLSNSVKSFILHTEDRAVVKGDKGGNCPPRTRIKFTIPTTVQK